MPPVDGIDVQMEPGFDVAAAASVPPIGYSAAVLVQRNVEGGNADVPAGHEYLAVRQRRGGLHSRQGGERPGPVFVAQMAAPFTGEPHEIYLRAGDAGPVRPPFRSPVLPGREARRQLAQAPRRRDAGQQVERARFGAPYAAVERMRVGVSDGGGLRPVSGGVAVAVADPVFDMDAGRIRLLRPATGPGTPPAPPRRAGPEAAAPRRRAAACPAPRRPRRAPARRKARETGNTIGRP